MKILPSPPITDDAVDPKNPPNEMDYVPVQALIDQFKALQPQLIADSPVALLRSVRWVCCQLDCFVAIAYT